MPEKQGAFPAALCGALTALSENYGTICSICCALILLDLLTGLRHLPGSAGGVRRCRRSGGGVPRPDRSAARLLHRRQRVHLHHRKPLGLRRPAARFSRRSPRKHQGQARPALTPVPIIPVPESAVNPAPAGSSSLAALAICGGRQSFYTPSSFCCPDACAAIGLTHISGAMLESIFQ